MVTRLIPLLLALVLAHGALAGDDHDPAVLVPIDRNALIGELSASKGRVVLVNLWATWCTPCLREIPDLLALEAELSGEEFRLLAVSMDDAYSKDWVSEFKAKHFPTLRSFINAELDMDTLVSGIDPVWNETLPTSYVLNREGEVVQKIQGKKPIAFFRDQLTAAGL
jgi:thiol-disulfide isomerase/thioredoxin